MVDDYLGFIRLFTGMYAPEGYAFCNGALLPISGNEALFAVIGNRYGGDGRTNFALPNLTVAFPMGASATASAGLTPHAVASKGGEATVIVSVDQMPAHTHAYSASTAAPATASPYEAFLPTYPTATSKFYSEKDKPTDALLPMNPNTIVTAGASQPHENMHPYLAINYVICTRGLFPV
uniref:phage tail protein n=1 Tax=Emticicia sp. 17c TaxID=3127704 RepID=UPI00301CB4EC